MGHTKTLNYLKLFQNLKVYFKKQCTVIVCHNVDEPQKYVAE